MRHEVHYEIWDLQRTYKAKYCNTTVLFEAELYTINLIFDVEVTNNIKT